MKLFSNTSILALSASAFLTVFAMTAAGADQTPVTAPDATKTDAPPSVQVAANTNTVKNGIFTGKAFDAYYGMVQVQATIQGGRLLSVDVLQSPNHQRTSRAINKQALPLLQQEVIQAQSIRVNLISGATLTSQAYLRSLRDAIKQAKN